MYSDQVKLQLPLLVLTLAVPESSLRGFRV